MEKLLTPSEVAAILQCSTTTVRSMVRSGQLPHMQIGEGKRRVTVRIPASALERFTVATPEELPDMDSELEVLHPAIAKAIANGRK